MPSFGASELTKVLVKMDNMWQDTAAKNQYMANADVLAAVRANQTANFAPLNNTDKDNKVVVTWLDACNAAAVDYVPDCTPSGDSLTSNKKEYEIDQPFAWETFISEEELRTNLFGFEDVFARATLVADKLLTEKWAVAIASKIEGYAAISANPYDADGAWSVPATGITDVPQSEWTPDILGHFILAGKLSKFANPYLLTGLNLAHRNWKAQLEAGQSGNEGNVQMFRNLRTYYDLFNLDPIAKRTYLIDASAVATVHKHWFGNTPELVGNGADLTRYSVASNNMPGVRYDVIYRTVCENDLVRHHFKFILRTGTFLNPTACTAGRTGVIGFKRS